MKSYHLSGYDRSYAQNAYQFNGLVLAPAGMTVQLPAGGRFLIKSNTGIAGQKVADIGDRNLYQRVGDGLVVDWLERFTTITLETGFVMYVDSNGHSGWKQIAGKV